MYQTHIRYDQAMHAFALYLDHELIGFARTHQEGLTSLNELVAELQRTSTPRAGHWQRQPQPQTKPVQQVVPEESCRPG